MNINGSRNAALKDHLRQVFQVALQAVNGERCVEQYLRKHPPGQNVWLIAIGKAACSMTCGASRVLGHHLQKGLVITKEGCCTPELNGFDVLQTGHPLPDQRSLQAGQQVLDFLSEAPANAELLVLISGGASALVEVLPAGLSIDDLHDVNRWLLQSGLPIQQMNAIRKQMSAIKGGRLAQRLGGRNTKVLLISDVQDDDPAVIGSGLLFPTSGALAYIDQQALPTGIQRLLAHALPMPGPDAPCFSHISWDIVASLSQAVDAANDAATRLGLDTEVHKRYLAGDAISTGKDIANTLRAQPDKFHIWGGETTVTLPANPGMGGRCQSLALSTAITLQHQSGWALLAAGTDGDDGNSHVAGACVDATSLDRARQNLGNNTNLDDYLQRADSASLFAASGDLVKTGPTGTNVTDLVLGYLQND
ncbi:MAG: DUF4147 domain-containing protein [Gammaproteobacteria bacterium]|jgi:hydroxypyruvate reductase